MWPRPAFATIPELPAPDPADYTEFKTLAAELLPADESALDQAALDLAALDDARFWAHYDMSVLGLEQASGAEELAAMIAEVDADTLIDEIAAASSQDAALGSVGLDVGSIWPEL